MQTLLTYYCLLLLATVGLVIPTADTKKCNDMREESVKRGLIDARSRNRIERGSKTLAFVFDTTGSMNDDLVQVREGAEMILSTHLAMADKPIHNFLLVEFNDPDVGPITITTEPEEFKAALANITVSGGGDCPEMALEGMKMALEAVLPFSYIYVFTDASAKDKYKLGQVLHLIQRKESQVIIVMTGNDCGDSTDKTYDSIASYSTGQVFRIDKDDIEEVVVYINATMGLRMVNLLSYEWDAGKNKFEMMVDNTIDDFIVSVSGTKPYIKIIGPKGEDLEKMGKIENILSLRNVKIVEVKEPTSGIYDITVGSESKYTVRARGESPIMFEQGFSLKPTANFEETHYRPLAGASSYILIKLTKPSEFGDIYRIQMLNLDGTILHDSFLKKLPGDTNALYNGTYFQAPEEPFYIKIFGFDETGSLFERLSTTAVSAQLPSPPELSSNEIIYGYTDCPATIECYVQSLLPFNLTWKKDGLELITPKTYPQSAEVKYVINSPTRDHAGNYTCLASNSAGNGSSNVFLDIKEII